MSHKLLFSLVLTTAFFLSQLLTLNSYNLSWDETIHFRRGQAYLHYFLTGLTQYDQHLSLFQSDIHSAAYFLNNDVGHPPLNDIVAATFNTIFFQYLHWMGDIQSYHLFNILASSVLVLVCVYFTATHIGLVAGLVTFFTLLTYPLFWSEAHFNIKDPALAAFFSISAIFLFNYFSSLKSKWLIWASLFTGIALGIKFNILFMPFIFVPLILTNARKYLSHFKSSLPIGILGGLIILFIFILTWPFLWHDTVNRVFKVLNFYQDIGTGENYQPSNFYVLGFNTYPIRWMVTTTPPIVLVLLSFGLIGLLTRPLDPRLKLFLICWFAFPLLRVSWPGSSLYGGDRQILEFLPPLAILAGIGFTTIPKIHSNLIAACLLFLWPTYLLVKLHPNQNVYFNFLIKGLSGAKASNFPGWGNSLGNAYLQGIAWLNSHAPHGAQVSLLQGTASNAPVIYFRPDLDYLVADQLDNRVTHFSGLDRHGEYLMELTFNDSGRDFHYVWDYVTTFLDPVYQVSVDHTPILTIWKNDLAHTKPQLSSLVAQQVTPSVSSIQPYQFDLPSPVYLSRLHLSIYPPSACLSRGYLQVFTTSDLVHWTPELDTIPQYQLYRTSNVQDGLIDYYFTHHLSRAVRLEYHGDPSCHFDLSFPQVYALFPRP